MRIYVYVCMKCFETFGWSIFTLGETSVYCPNKDCDSIAVDIDELIAPSIILLNQKGYLTKACCSGHWYSKNNTNAYVYFLNNYDLTDIPNGFLWDDERKDIMRATYDNQLESKYDFVIRINKELYKWVKKLPVRR